LRDLARYLAGSSRLPYLAELGTGWLTLPWLLPMRTSTIDEEHSVLRALAHGVRAANVYMLVERDRWYGSPIAADGVVRSDRAALFARLARLVDELQWETLRRDAPVLVVEDREAAQRVAARARFGNVVPCFSQMVPFDLRLLDVDDEERDAHDEWARRVTRALEEAGVECDRASSSALPDRSRYDLVLQYGDEVDGAALPVPAFRCDAPGVDLVRLTGSEREVLVAINGTAEPVDITVAFDGFATFNGRWTDETLQGDRKVTTALPPWGGQVWEVQR
jgi:hypothetical protein